MKAKVAGDGTKAKPWKLRTPSGSSEYEMYRAEDADPHVLSVGYLALTRLPDEDAALIAAGHAVRILDDLSTGALANLAPGAELVMRLRLFR